MIADNKPFVEKVRVLAVAISKKYPDDIPRATQALMEASQKLAGFKGYIDRMIFLFFREIINDVRHEANVKLKRDAGVFGGPPKVNLGASPAIQQTYKEVKAWYEFCIAGRYLGAIRGGDLLGLAEIEMNQSMGHKVNGLLLRRLSAIVPADKRVRDVVPEAKIASLYRAAKRKADKLAA
jgi:hypothetical protein